jgi:small subunit ribosomal protein S17
VEKSRNKRKTRIGEVMSRKMDRTCIVRVMTVGPHPFFKKIVKSFKKIYVHDAENATRPGDEVLIMETKPISKLKRWRLVKILKRREKLAIPTDGLEENQA